jgi:Ca2+-binding RTX toxin-like protein
MVSVPVKLVRQGFLTRNSSCNDSYRTSSLNDGTATLSTAILTVGTHQITAVYSGDSNFTTSIATSAVRQVVNIANININTPSPSDKPATPTGIQPFNGISNGFFNLTDNNDGTNDAPLNLSTLVANNLAVRALSGSDNLVGTAGADTIYGNQGNDSLIGSDGNDILRGGKGNDVLIGGNGDDVAIGDSGQDFLTGDTGADTFVLRSDPVALATSLDRTLAIADFNPAEGDKIGLTGIDFSQITLQPINLSIDEGASTSATVIVLSGTASYLAIVRGFAPENLNDPSLFVNADGLI